MSTKPLKLVAGDGIRIYMRFKDTAGVLTDPTGIALTIRRERDTPVVYDKDDLEKVTTGVYYHDIILDKGGRWKFYVQATGDVLAAENEEILVEDAITDD